MDIDIRKAGIACKYTQVTVKHESISLDLGVLNEQEVKELILRLSRAVTELCEAIE